MFKLAIPVLRVSNSAAAEEFYCNRLGFRRHFAYRLDETKPDPCYLGLARGNAWLHVTSFPGDGVSVPSGGRCGCAPAGTAFEGCPHRS